ncbi:MAG TPA: glycine oxidase ThiO [Candidatus Deferrimicrobiaceae bacterium]|nr:glycine oxidase ThiO [Candidatus Deferrimicrobiaceae bacterium]
MAALSVAVIGGGIIGCAAAQELAKRGCRVTLLERASPGAEASGAAAGLLSPLGPSPEPGPFHRLAIESWRLYPAVAAELRDLTGVDVEHMTAGTLYLLHSPPEIEAARQRRSWPLAAEFGIEVVEGSELRALEPALAKDLSAALLVRGDHWVNNQRLVTAYAAAAAARGVTVRTGVEVSRILVEGGRVRGVLVDGEMLHADAVLLAAGAWSGALAASAGLRLPVAPVRGQMLAVSNVPPLISRAIHGDDVYVVPRPSGEILIGATVEHAGFVRAVTPDGLGSLIAAAVALVPEIGRRPVTRSWCGFRPWVPDGQPVLGPSPAAAGLFVATAHFRNGILMAPITAALLTRCIVDGETPDSLTPFLPDRFL